MVDRYGRGIERDQWDDHGLLKFQYPGLERMQDQGRVLRRQHDPGLRGEDIHRWRILRRRGQTGCRLALVIYLKHEEL